MTSRFRWLPDGVRAGKGGRVFGVRWLDTALERPRSLFPTAPKRRRAGALQNLAVRSTFPVCFGLGGNGRCGLAPLLNGFSNVSSGSIGAGIRGSKAPKARRLVATGGAQRNPWEASSPKPSKPRRGEAMGLARDPLPFQGNSGLRVHVPRVPLRSTRGYRPTVLRTWNHLTDWPRPEWFSLFHPPKTLGNPSAGPPRFSDRS
jgi:hypothetical protein